MVALPVSEEVNNVLFYDVNFGGDAHVVQASVGLTEFLDTVFIVIFKLLAKASFLNLSETPESFQNRQPFHFLFIWSFHDLPFQHWEFFSESQKIDYLQVHVLLGNFF